MTTEAKNSGEPQAIEETLASFACEGIVFTEEEKLLIQKMDRQGLPADERIAVLKAYLASAQPKP